MGRYTKPSLLLYALREPESFASLLCIYVQTSVKNVNCINGLDQGGTCHHLLW